MDSLLTTKPTKKQQRGRLAIPLKTRITLFFISNFNNAVRRTDGSVNRRLFHLLGSGLKCPPDPKPRHGVSTYDITVDSSRNLWFRIFVPSSESRSYPHLPVLIFFHGGGFVYLSPDYKAYDRVCRRFAREIPAVVVSVNYRLAPEHRYPAQYEDGFDILKYLDDDRNDVLPENADLTWCFVGGDSAGGNLAHHVAKRACESKLNRVKVAGVVAIQPFFGGEERSESEIELAEVDVLVSTKTTDWMWKAFIPPGSGMNRNHEVINISGPHAADISKLDFPPTMVVVGGFDSLKDWQIRYYHYLKRSGKEAYLVEFPDMFHAFYVFPELPQSGHLLSKAKQFIHDQCSKSRSKEI